MFVIEELDSASWSLAGSGGSNEILALRAKLELKISNAQASTLTLSLGSLEAFNSQLLSLCLCLLRHAQTCGVELIFSNTPQKLFDMARVGGLEFILTDAA